MQTKKVKVTNPYASAVGLRLMDGMREVLVHPKGFIMLDSEEIFYINNMSSIFSKRRLLVQDDEVNMELGLISESTDVVGMTDEQIETLLKGNIMTMKKHLSGITDKQVIGRVIEVSKKIEDLATGKLKIIQEISGYDFDQLISAE
ncbi:hypothetical protein [Paenibacillus xylanexedens]|uniref:hypothetical protein n=1 Tax=Paenibacillus xylanexedens TaxID=528191 RepID=UPI000F531302|nr:hypothetical protein [Paenibacillus xylanexedens]RPK31847.1 hypothetical protein EDO6_02474 [Paenibacillus xylanexedens]